MMLLLPQLISAGPQAHTERRHNIEASPKYLGSAFPLIASIEFASYPTKYRKGSTIYYRGGFRYHSGELLTKLRKMSNRLPLNVSDTPVLSNFTKLEEKKLPPSAKMFVWQIFGAIGELAFKRYPPDLLANENGKRLLNLGCGDVRIPGFVNADFYRLHKLRKRDRPDWMLDITRKLRCQDGYWDGVILEHVNEHISYVANYHLFQEILRTLKPNGTLRIVVPDLDKYLRFKPYQNNEEKMNRYGSLPEAISNLTQNHAHISTWNYQLLETVLKEVGFREVHQRSFNEGADADLLVDSPNHVWQSVYCEATK